MRSWGSRLWMEPLHILRSALIIFLLIHFLLKYRYCTLLYVTGVHYSVAQVRQLFVVLPQSAKPVQGTLKSLGKWGGWREHDKDPENSSQREEAHSVEKIRLTWVFFWSPVRMLWDPKHVHVGLLGPSFFICKMSTLQGYCMWNAWHVVDINKWLQFLFFVFCFLFFFFLLFRAPHVAYGGSQARGLISAVAAGLHQIHSHSRYEPCLQPTPQLTAMPDPYPAEWGQGLNPQPHGS